MTIEWDTHVEEGTPPGLPCTKREGDLGSQLGGCDNGPNDPVHTTSVKQLSTLYEQPYWQVRHA